MSRGQRIKWDVAWVEDNFAECDNLKTLNALYNETHMTDICYRTFKGFCQRQGYKKSNITEEQDEFIRENYPKYGAAKTADIFNATFNTNKKPDQIKRLAHNRHLKIADEEVYKNLRVNKRGCKYKVGDVSKDWDIPYVKVGDNKWIRESLYKYTQAYGEVPEDCVILHLDRNQCNNDIDNLVAIPKRYTAKMARNWLYSHNATITKGALMLMELEEKIDDRLVFGQQTSWLSDVLESDNLKKKKQAARRKWENAFQKWSDKHGLDGGDALGCCGWGSMCDWCTDNSYGRPCVRALNAMRREKKMQVDYSDFDFEKIW